MWNRELGALSPVAAADQALDTELRADLGAPDVRYLVVVSAPDSEAALQLAEQVGERLAPLVDEGVLAGFESPARYLPSLATQARRRASLPEADELRRRLAIATADLPLRAERLAPFIADVDAARTQAPLTRADLTGTSLALAVDSMVVRHEARETGQPPRITALLPLKAPVSGPHANAVDVPRVRAALTQVPPPAGQGLLLVDMKGEMENLYASYLHEAILLSLAGLGVIVALLAATLRSARRVGEVLLPLIGAVFTVTAGLLLAGQQLTILHLIGLLLIVAVGSNYALFFNHGTLAPRTLASIILANLTTVAGFGVLGLSSVPILKAIGTTVGPGVVLALLFSAVLAQRRPG
jgi:predicted exporter